MNFFSGIDFLRKIYNTLFHPLSRYEKSDFSMQQRVMFLYRLLLAIIAFTILMILYTGYIQMISPNYGKLYYPVLIQELIYLFIVFICFQLLIKGHFVLSAHLLLISSISTVWMVIFLDKNEPLARLDTIVMIPAILTMLPIVIRRKKIYILLYVFVNIIILIVSMNLMRGRLNVPDSSIDDYIADLTITFIFVGVVSYSLYQINKKSLEKAVSDIKERHEAEKALIESERKFKELTDLLPQTVFESDMKGEITYINKRGLDLFGYTEEDIQNGLNVFEYISESDRPGALSNFHNTLLGEKVTGNLYSGLKKDGTLFPIQIYSRSFEIDKEIKGIRGIVIDISESVKAEEEIKKSRDQFQSLVSNIPGITYRCISDKDWTMLFLSSEIEKLCGYPSDEFINNRVCSFRSIIFEDDAQQVESAIEEAVKLKKPWEIEYRIKHHDGNIRWVYEKGRSILDPEGNVEYLDGFILDITERKLAVEALTESEQKYRTLIDNMNEVLMLVDNDDRVLYVNKRFTEILGYRPEEIIGDIGYKLLFDPRDQAIIKDAGNKRRNSKINDQYEITFTAKDGRKIYFLVSADSIYNSEGIEIGAIVAMTDITNRKMAEDALKQSEERYKTITEAFPDMIMIADLNGNIIFSNEAFGRVTGVTPDKYSDSDRVARIHPDDIQMINFAVQELLSGEKSHTDLIENRFIDNWGKLHWFSGVISKISLNNKTVLQTITSDITEKKLIEEELEKHRNNLEFLVVERTEELEAANEELKAINDELYIQRKELGDALNNLKDAQNKLIQSEKMASLGILASGVAHEINNPLNFIQGGILGLETYFNENLTDHKENVSQLFTAIKTGVQRSANIVKSLSHYNQKDDLFHAGCDIHAIIDDCLIMLGDQIKEKADIYKYYTESPYLLVGSEGKLHQAFLNIIVNAVQSIENKGTIIIRTNVDDDKMLITIEDTGCGIKAEDLDKIFDPFFSTRDPGKGTGLGLSITYTIIKEHNGAIEYHSEPGNGTIVKIIFPVKKLE